MRGACVGNPFKLAPPDQTTLIPPQPVWCVLYVGAQMSCISTANDAVVFSRPAINKRADLSQTVSMLAMKRAHRSETGSMDRTGDDDGRRINWMLLSSFVSCNSVSGVVEM